MLCSSACTFLLVPRKRRESFVASETFVASRPGWNRNRGRFFFVGTLAMVLLHMCVCVCREHVVFWKVRYDTGSRRERETRALVDTMPRDDCTREPPIRISKNAGIAVGSITYRSAMRCDAMQAMLWFHTFCVRNKQLHVLAFGMCAVRCYATLRYVTVAAVGSSKAATMGAPRSAGSWRSCCCCCGCCCHVECW